MNGIFHEIFSILTLFLVFHFLYGTISNTVLILISIGWLLQTLYINNDLDSKHSRSKKRIGFFKYLFYFTKHRGIMHTMKFWIVICIPLMVIKLGGMAIGIIGSAITHIVVDRVSTKVKRVI